MQRSDEHHFSVRYTEPIVRDAVRTYIWRRVILGQGWLWSLAALTALLLLWLTESGHSTWLNVVAGLVVLLPVLIIVFVWRAHHANSVGRFRRMRSPHAIITFSGEGFTASSDLGTATVPWALFTELWEQPRYWMLFTAPNAFVTLPTEDIPGDACEWLRAKLAESRAGPGPQQ